jgi:hypothetical protein
MTLSTAKAVNYGGRAEWAEGAEEISRRVHRGAEIAEKNL